MGISPGRHRARTSLCATALIAASAFVLATAAAQASTVTVGSPLTIAPVKATCGVSATFTDSALGAGTLAAPSNGVIVSWRIAVAQASGTQKYELRVLRPVGGSSYTGAGTGPPQSASAAGVNELTLPSPLPVQAGDIVGVNCPVGAPSPYTSAGAKGSIYAILDPTLADGSTAMAAKFPGEEILVNADFIGAPTVGSIAPTSGSIKGGASVTITGTNLSGASAVSFGGVPASSFTVNSDTQITAVAPASATPGVVDASVTTTAGTTSLSAADQFTYTACVVPKLKGKKLKAAEKKLKKADCKLGKIKGHKSKTAKVKKQHPKPGKVLAPGVRVSVKLDG